MVIDIMYIVMFLDFIAYNNLNGFFSHIGLFPMPMEELPM